MTIKIGILREQKSPPDKRVAFTPEQCKTINTEFKNDVLIVAQPSAIRCYTDAEYKACGITLQEDLSDCDVLMGVKEVPKTELIAGKKYFFFSHTIKAQPHNKSLVQALIAKKIQMVDYETLVDENMFRVIGFGHYAGIVGAYNGLRGYGLKYKMFDLKPANLCYDRTELHRELEKVKLSNIKIIVTGNGRVANGAIEILGILGIRRVTAYEFTHNTYREAVYTQLHSADYNEAKNGGEWNTSTFFKNPTEYNSTFNKYTKHCDLLMHCSFWDPRAPRLFTKDEMNNRDFKISVIADITCDIDGSIPSTQRSTTINAPFFGYNPSTQQEDEAFAPHTITVMAVDNLPCELPRDASENFGKELIERVLPAIINDSDDLLERASITKNGALMPRFEYLHDYAFN
jgi:saccharopine dehydrogenase (NAD+, L-lysine forming)